MDPSLSSRFLSALVVAFIRLLMWTWRVRVRNPEVLESALAEGATVLAFWHGEQLPMVPVHANRGFIGMASQSRDGALLASVIERLGYQVVRGSSSRGGARALRESLRSMREGGHPALAVDGPRGPRQVPHPGAVGLALRTGRPLIFGVSACKPCIHLPSWDRFAIPLPFARVEIAYGRMEPVGHSRAQIDDACLALGASMRALTQDLHQRDGQGLG